MSRSSKLHISTYAKRLIKQHIAYYIALIFFAVLIFTFIPFQIKQYIDVRKELAKTNDKITELDKRRSVITRYPVEELEDLVLTLNSLYPSVEDRFSIFTALDNLQGVTGLDIVTYSSPFAGKSPTDISIAVKSNASMTEFRRFLSDHIYKSGRFMTIEKIVFDTRSESLNFTGKFYSKNVDIENQLATQYSSDAISRLQGIQRELESAGLVRKTIREEDVTIPIDYSTKQNPFK